MSSDTPKLRLQILTAMICIAALCILGIYGLDRIKTGPVTTEHPLILHGVSILIACTFVGITMSLLYVARRYISKVELPTMIGLVSIGWIGAVVCFAYVYKLQGLHCDGTIPDKLGDFIHYSVYIFVTLQPPNFCKPVDEINFTSTIEIIIAIIYYAACASVGIASGIQNHILNKPKAGAR